MTHWLKLGLLAVFLATGVVVARSEAQTWENPERVAAVQILINDQVEDGCWPRPQATKEAVELVFRRAQIPIAEEWDDFHPLSKSNLEKADYSGSYFSYSYLLAGYPHQLEIYAFGWFDKSCIVSIGVSLSRGETLADWGAEDNRTIAKVYYGESRGLATMPKAEIQSTITNAAVELATGLANAILKVREE